MSRLRLIAPLVALSLGGGFAGQAVGATPPAYRFADPSARSLQDAGAWPSAGGLHRPATRLDLARALTLLLAPPAPEVSEPELPDGDWDAGAPDAPSPEEAEGWYGDPPQDDPAPEPEFAPGSDAAVNEVLRRRWVVGPRSRLRGRVTPREAERALVLALGLDEARRALSALSTEEGVRVRVPRGFADAVLSREAGLRYNHPTNLDRLERGPSEALPRGDLAYMAARAASLSGWESDRLRAYSEIRLPALSAFERRVVERALSQVGSPYVWGGEWPTRASPFGAQAHGGYDCSGLVWFTYVAGGSTRWPVRAPVGGRTADAMAWEAGRHRVRPAGLKPGDLVFFGDRGPRTKRGAIGHVGIALGGGWMVHSSGSRGGVSVSHLDSYWRDGLAFGRRMLARSS